MFGRASEIALDLLAHPWAVLSDPSERAFGPFLAGAFVIALGIVIGRCRSLRRALAALAAKRIWWHRSAKMDYRLILANGVIRAVLLAPLALSALAVALWMVELLTSALGEPAPSSLPRGAIVAVYTAVLFVAWDFSRYVLHRLLHEVPLLWELHKVHHSAEVLTPFTVYRVHPAESFLFQLRGALTTGLVTGIFFYAFQDRAVQYEILGVNALGVLFNATLANLRHSHVWLSFGRVLERLFISPAQHQIHHSVAPRDYGKNYGSCLAIWDWLGGTLRLAGRRRGLGFGLTADQRNHHPARATSALVGPLIAIARRIGARRVHLENEEHHETTPA